MDTDKIIGRFIEFFRDRGHRRLNGGTLIPPPGDPVLFTTSGMHLLTPYLLGRPHPLGRRLVNVQRCLRTTDLDEVGDDTHLTMFEMLGSWSLGDYDHPQSLRWGYELLRDGFGIDHDRLYCTVFGGDTDVGLDLDSVYTWQDLGVPVERTVTDNWWSNGPTGPCGPDSEIFVWTGDRPPQGTPGTDDRWVEVWNHVRLGYHRGPDGRLSPGRGSTVDTGLGLDRLCAVMQGGRSVFDGDRLRPWTRSVDRLWSPAPTALRIVSDHLRSGVVVIGDGVRPSNTGRGYVLRRLIRRALTVLWRDDPTRTLGDLPGPVIDRTLEHAGHTGCGDRVRQVLLDEERRFREVLRRGAPVVRRRRSGGPLGEDDYRYLHDTHGLPRDLVELISDRT